MIEYIWRVLKWPLSVASGEFMLRRKANGGDVVFVRALWIAVIIFLVAIGLHERLDLRSSWGFSLAELRRAAADNMEWFGAIFGAAYAGLYSRFASQWSYLAALYNQLMASLVQAPEGAANEELYTSWRAAFIEDAQDMHLALKPMFAAQIAQFLGDKTVRDRYTLETVDGEARLARLEADLAFALGHEVFAALKESGVPAAQRVPGVQGQIEAPSAA